MSGSSVSWRGQDRRQRIQLLQLLETKRERQVKQARDLLEACRRAGRLTAKAVASVAWLTMETDEGKPMFPAAHHWLWLKLLTTPEINRLLIIAPPESAKTSWLVAYEAASIGLWPELPRIYASASGDVAKKRIMAIRLVLESDRYRELFPDIKKAAGLPYEADKWAVAPNGIPRAGRIHPTLSAYGTGGAITGSRAFEAVGDDILDFENTRTAHQRNLVWSWFHNSFQSRVLSRIGRVVVIGTSWHHQDAYARLRDSGDYIVCHLPLLSDGEEVYATITYPPLYSGPTLGTPQIQENQTCQTNQP